MGYTSCRWGARGWLPSDPDAVSRASIKAWSVTEGLVNVRAPVAIDVREGVWGVEDDAPFDAMISLNMVHIALWRQRSDSLPVRGAT